MTNTFFPGQQSDEKVLYHTKPVKAVKYVSFAKIILVGLLVLFAFQVVALNLSPIASFVKLAGLILTTVLIAVGIWWVNSTHQGTDIFVTDRRFVKFSAISPLHKTTRALFWDETVKAKSYHKNAIWEKLLGVGSIEIHARSQDKDNIDVDHLIFHEDLANYIDKILYTYKSKPGELANFKEFVPKPRGKRD